MPFQTFGVGPEKAASPSQHACHPVSEPEATGPGRFLIRGLLGAAVVACLIVATILVAVPAWLVSPARVSRFLADSLPELKADITFEEAVVGWWSPLRLGGIQLRPRDGSTPPVKVRSITGNRGLAAMILSLGDLGRLAIDGLEVDLEFDANHEANVGRLFDESIVPDPARPSRDQPRRSPLRIQLAVNEAVLRIRGPWTRETWVSNPITLLAALAPDPTGRFSEWTITPVQILDHARMDPSVAQGILAYAAPVLADATRTSGSFSLRIDAARLPVGSPASGTLAGVLSMHAVDLGPGPLAEAMIAKLPGRLPAPPAIRVAEDSNVEFRLENRRVWHRGLAFGIPLARSDQRLDIESSGSVGIDDDTIDLKLALPIPADLPQDRPVLAALSGKTFTVAVGGTLDKPTVNFDGSLRATAGDVVADLLHGIETRRAEKREPPASRRPQESPDAAAASPLPVERDSRPPSPKQVVGQQAAGDKSESSGAASKMDRIKAALPPEVRQDPATDAVLETVGSVIDEIARRRAEKAAAAGQPARRGGLLKSLLAPNADSEAKPDSSPRTPSSTNSQPSAEP